MVCFLLVAYFRASFDAVNMSINLWSASINEGAFTLTAKILSIIFDTFALAVITFVVALIFFVLRHWKYGVLLLGAMAGDALLVGLFKIVVMSPRPLDGIIAVTGYSYPSGHTTGAVVFFGILTYFVWKHRRSVKVRALTSGLYVSATAIVGFDRIYLNVHWFSDVVGSVFLGAFWLTLCIVLFKFWRKQKLNGLAKTEIKNQTPH